MGFYKLAQEELACPLLRRLSGVSYKCGRGRQVELINRMILEELGRKVSE